MRRVEPERWRRRRSRDESSRWRHEALRLAARLEAPLASWQTDYLGAALLAASGARARGLSPLELYLQRDAVARMLAQPRPLALVVTGA